MALSREMRQRVEERAQILEKRSAAVQQATEDAVRPALTADERDKQIIAREAAIREETRRQVEEYRNTVGDTIRGRKQTPEATLAAREAARARAEQQAYEDAQKAVDNDAAVELHPGRRMTLHELNMIAKKADKERRDEIKGASEAAGRAVQTALSKSAGLQQAIMGKRASASVRQAALNKAAADGKRD